MELKLALRVCKQRYRWRVRVALALLPVVWTRKTKGRTALASVRLGLEDAGWTLNFKEILRETREVPLVAAATLLGHLFKRSLRRILTSC